MGPVEGEGLGERDLVLDPARVGHDGGGGPVARHGRQDRLGRRARGAGVAEGLQDRRLRPLGGDGADHDDRGQVGRTTRSKYARTAAGVRDPTVAGVASRSIGSPVGKSAIRSARPAK